MVLRIRSPAMKERHDIMIFIMLGSDILQFRTCKYNSQNWTYKHSLQQGDEA